MFRIRRRRPMIDGRKYSAAAIATMTPTSMTLKMSSTVLLTGALQTGRIERFRLRR